MDMENVIKGLEICAEHGSWHGLDCEHNEAYKDCPYRGCETGCIVTIAKDALDLIKEQETVEPQLSMSGLWYECPICHRHLLKDRDNYCARCGRRLKWK